MRGFCPVCLVEMRQWMAGDPKHRAVYDGMVYFFPGEKQLAMFNADPAKYLPALGGDDVVLYATTGQRIAGSLAHGVVHNGRPYFFSSPTQKQQFTNSPATYAGTDLALNGDCVVCRVEMNRQMPGAPGLTVIRDGLRYQFMGLEQQRLFESAPERFTSAAKQMQSVAPAMQPTAGSGSASR